jgi:hypothetical protein
MGNERESIQNIFIEQRIIMAIRGLLVGRVNEMLCDMQLVIPLVEFGNYSGNFVVVPAVTFSSCERTEKERIIRLDAYTMTISFTLPETPESELYCYAYSGTVSKAICDDPTLGGIVDRATITGKKFVPPKKPHCGEGWELVITLRITTGGMNNAG